MTDEKNCGIVCKLWRILWRPSVRYSLGTLLIVGFVAGIIFWGGFNTAMEISNTETFCISCHEMEENVYREYQNTVHYTNRTGVRATCPGLSRTERVASQSGEKDPGQ